MSMTNMHTAWMKLYWDPQRLVHCLYPPHMHKHELDPLVKWQLLYLRQCVHKSHGR